MPPEPIPMPESPDLPSDAIDFSDLDPFNEGDGDPEAGAETPEAGAPPAPKPTETPPANEDPIYEIPNYGQIRASEIKALVASRQAYSTLQQERDQLNEERTRIETESSRVSEAIQVRDLLEFPAVRRAMQQAVGQLFATGEGIDPARDGNSGEFFQGLPPQLRPQPAPEREPDPEIEALKEFKTRTEINGLFGELHQAHQTIVTQDFMNSVMDKALDLYRDNPENLGLRELRLVAETMIAQKESASRSNDAEVADAIRKLEPGARVVPGGNRGSVGQKELKDPRKLEWGDLENELGDILYAEEEA